RREGGVKLAGGRAGDVRKLEPQSRALLLNGREKLGVDRIARIPEEGHALRAWSDVTKHFEPLLDGQNTAAESRDVFARLAPVRNDSKVDGISSRHEDDRNLGRRSLRGEGGRRSDA